MAKLNHFCQDIDFIFSALFTFECSFMCAPFLTKIKKKRFFLRLKSSGSPNHSSSAILSLSAVYLKLLSTFLAIPPI